MKYIVTCREMKMLDSHTIQKKGIPSLVLMERAALKTAEEIEAHFREHPGQQKILCVCGSGNNGGDGIAIGRILFLHGFDVKIYMAGNPSHMTEETRQQLDIAGNYHVPLVNNPDMNEYTTIVDAIFGVGLSHTVEGHCRDVICQMNEASAWKVAVDIPSGVNGDTGMELGTAFCADLTVTYAFCKAGLCLYPGRKLAGKVVTGDIGIYQDNTENVHTSPGELWQAEDEDLLFLREREPDGNKGTFGKVLAVAGSPGMCGAAYLCSEGAFQTGAGMVRIRTAEENRIPLQTRLPEAMFSQEDGDPVSMKKDFDWCDVLVIGPGVGTGAEAAARVGCFLEMASGEKKPVVLDADGLNLLSENPSLWESVGENVILTPHMGEMSRLTGKTIGELKKDRIQAARNLAVEHGCVCVLKDACTVTAGPDSEAWLNGSGNPGMATAGSGDVLSGILAGILCRSISEQNIKSKTRLAAVGVYLHGRSGDVAAQKKGMNGMKAGDILKNLPDVLRGDKNEKI